MGNVTKGIGAVIIVVALANALGYLGNAYVDVAHRGMWIAIAGAVAILMAIGEKKKSK